MIDAPINKKRKVRSDVLNKCNLRCAYCGCDLSKGSFHLDHVIPKRRYKYPTDEIKLKGSDHIDNLLPCCKSCNYCKSDLSLEEFRMRIEKRILQLDKKSSVYRMAKKFGLIIENKKPIIFYFETLMNNAQ